MVFRFLFVPGSCAARVYASIWDGARALPAAPRSPPWIALHRARAHAKPRFVAFVRAAVASLAALLGLAPPGGEGRQHGPGCCMSFRTRCYLTLASAALASAAAVDWSGSIDLTKTTKEFMGLGGLSGGGGTT